MLSDRSFCVTIASALALVAFVFIMRFMPDFLDWQGWEWCGAADCNVQSWLSALSGWVAGIAAFATIKILVNQARAQQSQTDFTLGDAMPTCDLMEDDDNISTIVVRVVNWNRRTLLIEQIESRGVLPYNLKLDDVEVSQRKYQVLYDDEATEFDPPVRCGGWENRSIGPARALVRLRAVPWGTRGSSSFGPRHKVGNHVQIAGRKPQTNKAPGRGAASIFSAKSFR